MGFLDKKVRALVFVVLAAHAAFGAYVVANSGYFSLFPPFRDLATTQIFADLAVASGVVLLLLYRDLKRKGRSLGPLFLCALGILLVGSVAPLIYLLVEKDDRT